MVDRGMVFGPLEQIDVSGCQLWRFPTFVDSRGQLTVADVAAMPFQARRVFFILNVPKQQMRGNHALRASEELLLAISGSVVVTVEDGKNKQEITLRDPNVGLVIAPKIWRVLSRFSEGAVLAVFASHTYDPANQIRDYAEFLSIAGGNLGSS
jgi:UDP-2-acetamido-3-amino-2,3-dideoxy-glucuronate N-acetyltransferase